MPNNAFKEIIRTLEKQRLAIDRALAALQEVDGDNTAPVKKRGTKTGAKRMLSAEARERISAAQRKRWAGAKRAKKAAAKKVAG